MQRTRTFLGISAVLYPVLLKKPQIYNSYFRGERIKNIENQCKTLQDTKQSDFQNCKLAIYLVAYILGCSANSKMPKSHTEYPTGSTQPGCLSKPCWRGWKDTLQHFQTNLLTAEAAAILSTCQKQITRCLITCISFQKTFVNNSHNI